MTAQGGTAAGQGVSGALVLVRHGESSGNAEELFTGIMDVPVTDHGRDEVAAAGAMLSGVDLWPRLWWSSPMLRSRQTVDVLVAAAPAEPEVRWDGRLLERNYGALTGQAKQTVRATYGEQQFRQWRRSMDVAPPPMDDDLLAELSVPFADVPGVQLTATEALCDVVDRVGDWWRTSGVRDNLATGEDVLVVAHGNSLRALCAVLDDLTDAEVEALNIPNAHPLVYRFDGEWRPVVRGGTYLDPDAALRAAEVIALGGGT